MDKRQVKHVIGRVSRVHLVDDVARDHEKKHDAKKNSPQSRDETQGKNMLQEAEGSGPQDAGVEDAVGRSVRV